MATDGKIRPVAAHLRRRAERTSMFMDSARPWSAALRGLCGFRWLCRLRVVAGLLGALAVGGAAPGLAAAKPPHVILVSLDGTRPVDVTEADLRAVAALRNTGASARSMIGVTPSNTFPSHVSLITGVSPDRHGIVNNRFVDPDRGVFSKKDIPAWIEVEPLWSWLAGHGIVSASYYWVGSEGPWPKTGRGPLHWKPFSSKTREQTKVEQMLAWLDLDEAGGHPRFISSWFHGADHAGHHDGPGTEAASQSLREQNEAIEVLIDGLEARAAFEYTTLIFVSDHGMASAERRVNLGSVYKKAGITARVFGIGGFANVNLRAGEGLAERARRAAEIARGEGLEAHVRSEAPADWRVANVRFGDVVVRAPIGTAITYGTLDLDGYHGYSPEAEAMRAIFYARGRGVAPGLDLGVVQTVDVAPTVVHLLGLEPPSWMEGRVIEGLRDDTVPAGGESARLGRSAASAAAGGHE